MKAESQQQFNKILDDENAIAKIKTEEFILRLSGYSLHLKEKRQQLIQEEKGQ